MKSDRLFPFVSIVILAGLILAFVSPTQASHADPTPVATTAYAK